MNRKANILIVDDEQVVRLSHLRSMAVTEFEATAVGTGFEALSLMDDPAEADRLAREQAAHDRVLLDTFTTERDLLLARDGKLGAIDSRVKHQEQVVARLAETLVDMQGEAARLERAGKKVPDDLLTSITSLETRIEDNRAQIERRHAEKKEVAARFDADLTRYRELKGTR